MAKQNTRGGVRAGAGRKPVNDKKVGLFVYVPRSVIDALGGQPAAKQAAERALIRAAKKKV